MMGSSICGRPFPGACVHAGRNLPRLFLQVLIGLNLFTRAAEFSKHMRAQPSMPVRSAFRLGSVTFCRLRLIRTLLVDQVNGVVVHDVRPVSDKRPAGHRASKPERVRWNPRNHAQNLVPGGRSASIRVAAADALKRAIKIDYVKMQDSKKSVIKQFTDTLQGKK